jgi:hypothetical protein
MLSNSFSLKSNICLIIFKNQRRFMRIFFLCIPKPFFVFRFLCDQRLKKYMCIYIYVKPHIYFVSCAFRLVLRSVSFLLDFPPGTTVHSCLSIHCICRSHFILFDLMVPIVFGEVYKLWSPLLCKFLFPCHFILLRSTFLLIILFSNTFSMFSSLNV